MQFGIDEPHLANQGGRLFTSSARFLLNILQGVKKREEAPGALPDFAIRCLLLIRAVERRSGGSRFLNRKTVLPYGKQNAQVEFDVRCCLDDGLVFRSIRRLLTNR